MFSTHSVLVLLTILPNIIFGDITKFGCTFLNDEYEVDEKLYEKWGYGKPVEALKLSDEKDLVTLLDDIQTISGEVFSEDTVNTVDNFLDFYDAVSKANASDKLGEFFKIYKPKFRPHTDAFGITADVLDRLSTKLAEKRPSIAKNIFIGAVQFNIHTKEEKLNAVDEAYLNTEVGKRITNVVGVLRFTLPGRPGYIVFDSGDAISPELLVVMEDGDKPTKDNAIVNKNEIRTTEYKILAQNKKFIVGKYATGESEGNGFNYFLMYVGAPFCLPRYKPEKFELLTHRRYLVKRDADLTTKGGLYFYALPTPAKFAPKESEKNTYYRFIAFTVSENKREYSYVNRLNFDEDKGNTFSQIPQKDGEVLTEVSKILNETLDELVLRIRRIQKLMNDQKFLNNVRDLERTIYTISQEFTSGVQGQSSATKA